VDAALQPAQAVHAVHADLGASPVQSNGDDPEQVSLGVNGSARALATLAETSQPLRENILRRVADRAADLPNLALVGGFNAVTQLLETLGDRVLPACGPMCSDAGAGPVADLARRLLAFAQSASEV
jgi:hypothetical protein